jgi:hypothetical protein
MYSKDKNIYFENNIIKEADIETFEIGKNPFWAKDKKNYYNCENIVSKDRFLYYDELEI